MRLPETQNSSFKSRLPLVDGLRGLALVGVGLVHYLERFAAGPLPSDAGPRESAADYVVTALMWSSFGKFFALFSLLFGLSYALSTREALDWRASRRKFLRRSAVLLLIGLIHQTFYRGDILIVYALCAPLLPWLWKRSTKRLMLLAGLLLLGLPRLVAFSLTTDGNLFGLDVLRPDVAENLRYVDVLAHGGWVEVARSNLSLGLVHKAEVYLGLLGRGYYVVGYFTLGLLLGRSRLIDRIQRGEADTRPLIKPLAVALLPVSGAMILLFGLAGWPVDWSAWPAALALNVYDWTNVLVAALIGAWFCFAFRSAAWPKWLVPYGRMALTNYLLQSLVGTALLYGWGGGWLLELRGYQLLLLYGGITATQLVVSHFWLGVFSYGPVEYLWRAVTVGGWPRMRRRGVGDERRVKQLRIANRRLKIVRERGRSGG